MHLLKVELAEARLSAALPGLIILIIIKVKVRLGGVRGRSCASNDGGRAGDGWLRRSGNDLGRSSRRLWLGRWGGEERLAGEKLGGRGEDEVGGVAGGVGSRGDASSTSLPGLVLIDALFTGEVHLAGDGSAEGVDGTSGKVVASVNGVNRKDVAWAIEGKGRVEWRRAPRVRRALVLLLGIEVGRVSSRDTLALEITAITGQIKGDDGILASQVLWASIGLPRLIVNVGELKLRSTLAEAHNRADEAKGQDDFGCHC